MTSNESVMRLEDPTGDATATPLPINGVNAHLRLKPRDPDDFWVVVTFHHADGSLCEAELKPFEAAGLMSEIAHVIDQGNSPDLHSTSDGNREALDG